MSGNFYHKPGTWNVICDVCGFKYKSDQVRLRWDGRMVCDKDWETRHPQDLPRPARGQIPLPFVRPEPEDEFILVCTVAGRQSLPDSGVADCMICELVTPS